MAERAARAPVVDHLPYYYSIHLNKPCNQRCIMCVPSGQHPRDVLSFEDFVTLFEQIKPYAEHMTLIGGETFMYPQIPEVLELPRLAPDRGHDQHQRDDAERPRTPRPAGPARAQPQVLDHAATPETYLRVRGRDHFERVTANMRRFAELSRDMPDIRLITVYVVMRENLHEVLPFIEFAETLDPHRVEFHPVSTWPTGTWRTGRAGASRDTEQVCESFPEEYNEVMQQAADRCEAEGMDYEVIPL